jgi:hypothetical protein
LLDENARRLFEVAITPEARENTGLSWLEIVVFFRRDSGFD